MPAAASVVAAAPVIPAAAPREPEAAAVGRHEGGAVPAAPSLTPPAARAAASNVNDPGSARLPAHGMSATASGIATTAGGGATALLAAAEAARVPFEDSEFPAAPSSLWHTSGSGARWAHLKWLRAHAIAFGHDLGNAGADDAPLALFDADIVPDDVRQGQLGDCYFMSALAAVAERPALIRGLFLNDAASDVGAYAVRLYVDGAPVEIVVDDRFPCMPDGRPAFTRGKGRELWVLVLEKAWAKLHGSYEAIESGGAGVALSALLGVPHETLRTCPEADDADGDAAAEPPQGLRSRILAGRLGGSVMCASIGAAAPPGELDAVGLVGNHEYSVVDAREVDDTCFVRLRNPWGRGEWSGAYSDKSPAWTPGLKAALEYADENDGTFWMALEDFERYFETVSLVPLRPHAVREWVAADVPPGSTTVVEFEVPSPGAAHASITLHQAVDRRGGAGVASRQGVCRARFQLAGVRRDGGLEYIGHSRNVRDGVPALTMDLRGLAAGGYRVFVDGAFGAPTTCLRVSTYADVRLGLALRAVVAGRPEAALAGAYERATRAHGSPLGGMGDAGRSAWRWTVRAR